MKRTRATRRRPSTRKVTPSPRPTGDTLRDPLARPKKKIGPRSKMAPPRPSTAPHRLAHAVAALDNLSSSLTEARGSAPRGLKALFRKKYKHQTAITEITRLRSALSKDAGLLKGGLQRGGMSDWVMSRSIQDVRASAGLLGKWVEPHFSGTLRDLAGYLSGNAPVTTPPTELATPDPEVEPEPNAPSIEPSDLTEPSDGGKVAPGPSKVEKASEKRDPAMLKGASETLAKIGTAVGSTPEVSQKKGFFKKRTVQTSDHAGASAAFTDLSADLAQMYAMASDESKKTHPKGTLFSMAEVALSKAIARWSTKIPAVQATRLRALETALVSGVNSAIREAVAGGALKKEDIHRVGDKIGEGGANMPIGHFTYMGMPEAIVGKVATSEWQHEELVEETSKGAGLKAHKNTLGVHGTYDYSDSVKVMLMEAAEGGDVEQFAAKLRGSNLSDTEKVQAMQHLMKGAFSGLNSMHEQGLMHSDIKGENIFMGDDFTPKLGDFGTVEREGKGHTHIGTAAYMAPEVVTGKATKMSDVWSMGETLLMSLLDMNSVDVAQGKSKTYFHQENMKQGALSDGSWLTPTEGDPAKLDAAIDKALPDLDTDLRGKLLSFLKGVLQYDATKRTDAKGALKHGFLKDVLSDEDAIKLHKRVTAKKKASPTT